MIRPVLLLFLLTTAVAAPRSVPLPTVQVQAPGFAVRAQVRPAESFPEEGAKAAPYWQFSPAQVRLVLDRPGTRWSSAVPGELPPAYVTVTPVDNWLTLYRGPARVQVQVRLELLRRIASGQTAPDARRDWTERPFLPLLNSAQFAAGAVRRLDTAQVRGLRYLALYAQETMLSDYPRSAVFYTYQGLSRDGRYVVSVRLPYAPTSFPVGPGKAMLPEAGGLEVRDTLFKRLDAETNRLAALDRVVQSIRIGAAR